MKLVIGYELNGQVYAIYSLIKPYGYSVDGRKILEPNKVSQAVREIKSFKDETFKLDVNISEVLLSLPPCGLQVYDTIQTTTVYSNEAVGSSDLMNIYTLIKNSASKMSSELVDVVPEKYILDDDRQFSKFPENERSCSLTATVKVHTLPKDVTSNYFNVLKQGEIKIKKPVIAPFAAIQLLSTYPEVPNSYLLVDIGSNLTTVSLVGNKQLFASSYFEWGGDYITERIREAFNLNEAYAEKYKILYGIDDRKMNFSAPVCTTKDFDGNEIKHYNNELNEIIKKELTNFVSQLNRGIDQLLNDYDPTYKSLPIVLIGGGSRLKGLVKYLQESMPFNDSVQAVLPKTIGARNASFTNCLGMILANAKYPSYYNEPHMRIPQITRGNEE